MPLGSTHDRITLWTLPGVALGIGMLTRDSTLTLAVSSAYLFSGLMFSGDLDTRSRQYQRWLGLRWIWLPYRHWLKHRSLWSHGPIVGTVVRVLYLGSWLSLFALGILGLGLGLNLWTWQPQIWMIWLTDQLWVQGELLLWVGLGLELGSTNHSLSDWTISAWKRRTKSRNQTRSRPSRRSKPLKHRWRSKPPPSRTARSRGKSCRTPARREGQ